MTDMADIREGLATNLRVIPDLQVSPYVLASPSPPAAEIVPASVNYDESFQRGGDTWTLTVRVFIGSAADINAQVRLDRMLASAGPLSVKEALEADDELGGAVDDVRVTSCTGYRQYGDTPVLGCEWEVRVLAPGH